MITPRLPKIFSVRPGRSAIGSAMLNREADDPPVLKGRAQHDPHMGSVSFIPDGRQTVTTLYLPIRAEFPPYHAARDGRIFQYGGRLGIQP